MVRGHAQVLSELFDRCHETLEQYSAFVASTLTPAEYAALMPPVGELCAKYHLEPEVRPRPKHGRSARPDATRARRPPSRRRAGRAAPATR